MTNAKKAGNGKNNDVQVRIAEQWSPIQDVDRVLRGKSQERIAALHITPARNGEAAKVKVYFTPEGIKIKTITEGSTIQNNEGDITIRKFLAHDGTLMLVGNAELRRCVDQPILLDALTRGLELIQTHKGNPCTRLHLSGKNEVTLARIGSKWVDMTPKGKTQVHAIDVDPTTGAFYGFRAEADGRRTEIVKCSAHAHGDLINPRRWDTITVMPASGKTAFYDASRMVRDSDGTLRFQVAFNDGMSRGGAITTSGQARWTDPMKDDRIVLSRVWFGGNHGIVAQQDTPDGDKFWFYPDTEVPAAYKPYASAPQAS